MGQNVFPVQYRVIFHFYIIKMARAPTTSNFFFLFFFCTQKSQSRNHFDSRLKLFKEFASAYYSNPFKMCFPSKTRTTITVPATKIIWAMTMDKPNHPDVWHQKTGLFYVALKALFHNKTNECHNEVRSMSKLANTPPKREHFKAMAKRTRKSTQVLD